MRYQDDGSTGCLKPSHRANDHLFGVRVQVRRGLVQDNQRPVIQQGSGQGKALPLAN